MSDSKNVQLKVLFVADSGDIILENPQDKKSFNINRTAIKGLPETQTLSTGNLIEVDSVSEMNFVAVTSKQKKEPTSTGRSGSNMKRPQVF